MDEIQKKYVLDIVENEGFEYAFFSYSDFKEIESVEFHKARLTYLDAARKLADLIGYKDL